MDNMNKKPISKETATKWWGANRIETVEDALVAMSAKMSSEEFIQCVRSAIDSGHDVECVLTVKSGNQGGYVVNLSQQLKQPKKSFGTLLRLD